MNSMPAFSQKQIILPTKAQLDEISFRSSYAKSLNKRTLTNELLEIIKQDSIAYYNIALTYDWLFSYDWRIKSQDSITKKFNKGIQKSLRFNTTFNDLLGLRIRVKNYDVKIPDYFRVVDMRNGKKDYDGYSPCDGCQLTNCKHCEYGDDGDYSVYDVYSTSELI